MTHQPQLFRGILDLIGVGILILTVRSPLVVLPPENAEQAAWRTVHSQNPDLAYELVEQYFPTLPKIELNARSARSGWVSRGNEPPQQPTAEAAA